MSFLGHTRISRPGNLVYIDWIAEGEAGTAAVTIPPLEVHLNSFCGSYLSQKKIASQQTPTYHERSSPGTSSSSPTSPSAGPSAHLPNNPNPPHRIGPHIQHHTSIRCALPLLLRLPLHRRKSRARAPISFSSAESFAIGLCRDLFTNLWEQPPPQIYPFESVVVVLETQGQEGATEWVQS